MRKSNLFVLLLLAACLAGCEEPTEYRSPNAEQIRESFLAASEEEGLLPQPTEEKPDSAVVTPVLPFQ